MTSSERATLSDISAFLFGIQRWHRLAATNFLCRYESASVPDRNFSEDLAKRVLDASDVRSAGLIICASSQIDAFFAENPKQGFSYYFVQALGLDFILGKVRSEPRISIVYHLIEGLSSIDHNFLHVVVDEIADRIAESINQGIVNPWPARLAVSLSESELVGSDFLKAIRADGRIDRSALLDILDEVQTLDSIEAFHRFLRLFDGLAGEYCDRVPSSEADLSLRRKLGVDGRADFFFSAALSVRETFRVAGRDCESVISDDFPFYIFTNAFRSTPAQSVGAALYSMQKLLPDSIDSFVKMDRSRQIFNDKLSRIISNPAASVDLINALEKASRREGLRLLDSRLRRTSALMHQIQYLQNPHTVFKSINGLIRVGYMKVDRFVGLYHRVFEGQVQHFRSPGLLVELFKMVRSFDEFSGTNLFGAVASNVDRDGLVRRLRFGLVSDIKYVAALSRLLGLAGREDLARDLLSNLLVDDGMLEAVPSDRLFGLVRVVCDVAPELNSEYFFRLDAVFVTNAGVPCLLDDVGFWRNFGAYSLLRRVKMGENWAAFDDHSYSLSIPKDLATRMLATAWLDSGEWLNNVQNSTADEIVSKGDRVPNNFRDLVAAITTSEIAPECFANLLLPSHWSCGRSRVGRLGVSDSNALFDLLSG